MVSHIGSQKRIHSTRNDSRAAYSWHYPIVIILYGVDTHISSYIVSLCVRTRVYAACYVLFYHIRCCYKHIFFKHIFFPGTRYQDHWLLPFCSYCFYHKPTKISSRTFRSDEPILQYLQLTTSIKTFGCNKKNLFSQCPAIK